MVVLGKGGGNGGDGGSLGMEGWHKPSIPLIGSAEHFTSISGRLTRKQGMHELTINDVSVDVFGK